MPLILDFRTITMKKIKKKIVLKALKILLIRTNWYKISSNKENLKKLKTLEIPPTEAKSNPILILTALKKIKFNKTLFLMKLLTKNQMTKA
jgi:hypothetical protein